MVRKRLPFERDEWDEFAKQIARLKVTIWMTLGIKRSSFKAALFSVLIIFGYSERKSERRTQAHQYVLPVCTKYILAHESQMIRQFFVFVAENWMHSVHAELSAKRPWSIEFKGIYCMALGGDLSLCQSWSTDPPHLFTTLGMPVHMLSQHCANY